MYAVVVTAKVKAEHVQGFIDATARNARASRQEAGNVRFDVLQAEQEPTHFVLYEAYGSAEDFKKHQATEHYLAWKAAVAGMMAEPRSSVKLTAVVD